MRLTDGDETTVGSAARAPWDFDRTQKPADEAEYFTSFHHLEPDIHSGAAVPADRPDFRIAISGRVIGVELTKIFKVEARQDIESTQEKILNYACKAAIEMGLPPVAVGLFPNFRGPFSDAGCHKIADSVVQVVRDNLPASGDSATLDMRPGQPSEVDLILVDRRNVWESGRWHWVETAKAEKDAVRVVQEGIDKKANLLSAYLNACDECWLLLVADGVRPSGKFDFDAHFRAHMFASPFARSYVLDFAKGNLHRLTTAEAGK